MGLMKLVSIQGWVGIAVGLVLSTLFGLQVFHTNHWKHQSEHFESLYQAEKIAHQQAEINYRKAVDQARAEDAANAARVAAQQAAISKQKDASYEARIADARARADRLRAQLEASAHSGGGRDAPVSGLSAGPRGPDEAAGKDGLSDALLATEQAIQLDELIKWVREQHAVTINGDPHPSH